MNEEALPRVLCVDDEPKLLSALERNLYADFEMTTATSGAEAIELLKTEEPFAVILSDMRMPEMDGAAFLAQARQIAPDSARMLLTGQTDMESAVKAINEGAIYRFMTKPCPKSALTEALNAGVEQNRLVKAERELLEQTLTGVVSTLSEVLALAAPIAYQRANFVQGCVRHALAQLSWVDGWKYEVAAALSQIGCVSIPAEVLQKDAAQRTLSEQEQALLDGHPEVAYRLVKTIPRLETVAKMIFYQTQTPPEEVSQEVMQGAQLLRASLAMQRQMGRSQADNPQTILKALDPPIPLYLIQALEDFRGNLSEHRSVKVNDMCPGWVTEEAILSKKGLMILPAGVELSETAISTLRRQAANQGVQEPIRVLCKT